MVKRPANFNRPHATLCRPALGWLCVLAFVFGVVAGPGVPARAEQQAGLQQKAQIEPNAGRPIRRLTSTTGESEPDQNATPVAADRGAGQPTIAGMSIDIGRVVTALAIVIGLIFALRYVARRWLNLGASTSAGAVRVVSRTLISPRQQVLLLQVGRRIVVACDSAGHVTTLTQITDADEIAEILGKSEAKASLAGGFASTLEDESRQYESEAATGELGQDPRLSPDGVASYQADPVVNLRGEIGSLIARVRSLSNSVSTPAQTALQKRGES